MSNSSRIEAATRQHVGATLTTEQIVELVKVSDPNWKGGVYPSDVAYKQTPEGLVPRGKTAYGDGILLQLGSNSYRVLPTNEIVRRKNPVVAPPAPAPAPAAKAAKATAKKAKAPKAQAQRQQATA
jgi:hypothetical protein